MPLFRILVVDDFEDFRRFVCSVLEPTAEFQVTEASNGLEAVQKAEELQPDLILLDISLPGLNGLEVAKQVRKLAPGAKLLFISIESDRGVVSEALDLGASYIHKPHLQSDLLSAIEAVLRGEQFVSRDLSLNERTGSPHRHELILYSDDEALLDALTHFVAAALKTGDPAIVWATESHRASLLQRLRAQGVDIDAAIRGETYVSADVADPPDRTRMVEALRALSAAASKAGKRHPRIAVCGERANNMWAEGKTDEAIRLEQLLNELTKQHDVDILCPYTLPQGQQEHPAFKRIRSEHSAIYSR